MDMNGKCVLELSYDDEKLVMNRIIQENPIDSNLQIKNLWVLEPYSELYSIPSMKTSCVNEIQDKENLVIDFVHKADILNNHSILTDYLSFIDEINRTSTLKAFILYSLKFRKIPLLENKQEVFEFLEELEYNLKLVK